MIIKHGRHMFGEILCFTAFLSPSLSLSHLGIGQNFSCLFGCHTQSPQILLQVLETWTTCWEFSGEDRSYLVKTKYLEIIDLSPKKLRFKKLNLLLYLHAVREAWWLGSRIFEWVYIRFSGDSHHELPGLLRVAAGQQLAQHAVGPLDVAPQSGSNCLCVWETVNLAKEGCDCWNGRSEINCS